MLLILGDMIVILLGVVPANVQCMLTAWMGGGYCYNWGEYVLWKNSQNLSCWWSRSRGSDSFGVMYGEWVAPGDAVLDTGDQLVCCYGQRSTGLQYGFCRVCR